MAELVFIVCTTVIVPLFGKSMAKGGRQKLVILDSNTVERDGIFFSRSVAGDFYLHLLSE